MKKIILLFIYSLSYIVCLGQSTLYLRGKNYDAVYSINKKRPILVYYELSQAQLRSRNSVPLKYPLCANPEVPATELTSDFYNSGYVRAYMMPVADNQFDDQGMKECNYYTNIIPQTPALKRGPWRVEENYERMLVKKGLHLTVLCGGRGSIGTIGKDKVDVPAECWKIVIMEDRLKHLADTIAYLFPNDGRYKGTSPDEYEISYSELEAKLGFEITDMTALHSLRDSQEQVKEILENAGQKLDSQLKEETLDHPVNLEHHSSSYRKIKILKRYS